MRRETKTYRHDIIVEQNFVLHIRRQSLLGHATAVLPSADTPQALQALVDCAHHNCLYRVFRWIQQNLVRFQRHVDREDRLAAPQRVEERPEASLRELNEEVGIEEIPEFVKTRHSLVMA